jgi:hypothetical protein
MSSRAGRGLLLAARRGAPDLVKPPRLSLPGRRGLRVSVESCVRRGGGACV